MPKVHEMRALIRQTDQAERTMAEFEAYAKQIGCTVQGDAILTTNSQLKILNTWWKARMHASNYAAGERKIGQ
jgi:hypothetical protein